MANLATKHTSMSCVYRRIVALAQTYFFDSSFDYATIDYWVFVKCGKHGSRL